MDLTKCINGIHDLKILFQQHGAFNEAYIARWCPACGTVVVDLEDDDGIYPGRVVAMKSPQALINAETEKL